MNLETRLKISQKLKGRKPWNAGLKGVRPKGLTFKGQKHTFESKEKTRLYFLGRKKTPEHKKKLSIARIGKFTGEANGKWKGGITPLVMQIRTSFEYRQWRSDCFTRDYFTCMKCSDDTGGNLRAHHIKRLVDILRDNNIKTLEEAKKCSELWNINNSITLCESCHSKEHSKKLI